ncbi:uncharacterized protein I206_103674 [Kwoniella pini CBS 10737]|uniref:BHLH domain-containing protein n=1 Tax=Kwoniella pini CBS 10737 TaxID=1296096 RepID=A0AAJ8L5J9_9TREE
MSASTSTSHAASPTNLTSTGQGQNQDGGELFSLDFLALAGLDSGMSGANDMTSPTNSVNGQNHFNENQSIQNQLQQWEQGNNHAGPSNHLQSHNHPATATRKTGNDSEHYRSGGNTIGHRTELENAMDLDQPDLGRLAQTQQESFNGQDFGGGGQEYDALQAALLQQQLQGIHMQSPLGFDINNPQFPLAQMFLSSPGAQMAQLQKFMQNENGGHEGPRLKHRGSVDRNWQAGLGGMPTPGSSGEIIPQNRQEAISPMHLEMLARGQSEFGGDPNMLPLLSPALSHSTSTSFHSPSTQIAFNPQSHSSSDQGGNRSPLEQLQEQQRQFQEQLAVLQQRQLEMQATAAAVVAASSNSPYVGGSNPPSGPSRPATTPGTGTTPTSAGFFSPLTSPALEATNRFQQQHFSRQQFSPAFNAQQARTPHPLSALSSPALNPVGSSGGAQQTLSPALGPQTGADLSDPDYLRALVGMLDGESQNIGQPAQQSQYHSPSIASSSSAGHSTILASPALIPTNSTGAGPHRHSLPAKTRPSPMLKPTNHRSHQRVPSGTPNGMGHGNFSVPTSPAVQKFHPNPPSANMLNMGYLPPSAIENRNLAPSSTSISSASTPSPVDLSHMMPPPPVPSNGSSKSRKGVAPMTPASLMNLGAAPLNADMAQNQNFRLEDQQYSQSGIVPPPAPAPPKRGTPASSIRNTRKQSAVTNNSNGNGGKKTAGSKLVPVGGSTGNGKRALAIRPHSAAASRTAAKPPPPPTEPENRKTSHKAAEQKRRDSLKAGFDELRLLLPPINVEALDPESGEPIPGSSAPRLLPKSSLVPDDNPNRGVSKVALLRFGNEYIERLKERVDRRDDYIERLRREVKKLRSIDIDDEEELNLDGDNVDEEGEELDILEYDWREGEEEEFDPPALSEDILDENGEIIELEEQDEIEGGEEINENMENHKKVKNGISKRSKSISSNHTKSPALKATNSRRPSLIRGNSSANTVTGKK